MLTSLDGKIMGNYMEAPESQAAGEAFYNIAFGPAPQYRHQGWFHQNADLISGQGRSVHRRTGWVHSKKR